MLQQLLQRKHGSVSVDVRKVQFQVNHFAGSVSYLATQMPSSNLDTLPVNAVALASSSSDTLLSSWFTNVEAETAPTTPVVAKRSGPVRSGTSGLNSPVTNRKAAGARKASIGLKFRGQLQSLMGELQETQRHFIRAVKPNNEKKPLVFIGENVRIQLEQGGVLEVAKVRQAGFEIHLSHQAFQELYVGMSPPASEEGITWFKGRR